MTFRDISNPYQISTSLISGSSFFLPDENILSLPFFASQSLTQTDLSLPFHSMSSSLSSSASIKSAIAKCRRLSASAILFVIVRVASCEKSCKRVTSPLQLESFFICHRCVAICRKKLLRATWPLVGAQREQRRAKKYGRNAWERSTSPLFIPALAVFRAICLN